MVRWQDLKKYEKHFYYVLIVVLYPLSTFLWCKDLYRDMHGVKCAPYCSASIVLDILNLAVILFGAFFFGYVAAPWRRRK